MMKIQYENNNENEILDWFRKLAWDRKWIEETSNIKADEDNHPCSRFVLNMIKLMENLDKFEEFWLYVAMCGDAEMFEQMNELMEVFIDEEGEGDKDVI